MFRFQKIKKTIVSLDTFYDLFKPVGNDFLVFDSETTGLNFMRDTAFLCALSWRQYACAFEPTADNMKKFLEMAEKPKYLFAHNAKYDYHICINTGYRLSVKTHVADSMTVARLTTYVDDEDDSISLESLGAKYVDPESKFAGKIIRQRVNEINKARLSDVKRKLKEMKVKNITALMDAYRSRVQFVPVPSDYVELFKFIDENYAVPNYYDVYKDNKELVINYILDDVVILQEYLEKAMPLMYAIGDSIKVLEHENALIPVVADMERNGLRTDVQYLLDSRERVLAYQKEVYDKLAEKTGVRFTSGQHNVIKKLFFERYGIQMQASDLKALEEVRVFGNADATEVANYIIELRTLDKWLSTYIEGMLDRVYNGRVYTSINNNGTVTGRVSSDLQQQPKEALTTSEGVELFHPRRATIVDEGTKTFYFDYSQMELRVQAHYTVVLAGGDFNLCSAFMPINCTSIFTGEKFEFPKHQWDSGEWVDENFHLWKPRSVHDETTMKAFPWLTKDHPEWDHYRRLGKMCNFLKNYGGGILALQTKMGVSPEIAASLNRGYYEAFPKILTYQKWVEAEISKYGFVTNVFGRRYYMQSLSNSYKAYNYLIQGGCADIVKDKELRVAKLLEGHKSKMLLPVHDELMISIVDGEEYLVPSIKEIMDDCVDLIPTVPMISDVEYTITNWAEKIDFEG